MKDVAINFFVPEDNQQPTEKKAAKKIVLTGYISTSGKLVFPNKTTESLGTELDNSYFRVGVQQGKRKVKSLFLIPSTNDGNSFPVEKASKSYFISLSLILQKCGIDFSSEKYTFVISSFDYEGTSGLQLTLSDSTPAAPKAPYTGKPRGRKPKSQAAE